jgi:hypothetical protein
MLQSSRFYIEDRTKYFKMVILNVTKICSSKCFYFDIAVFAGDIAVNHLII